MTTDDRLQRERETVAIMAAILATRQQEYGIPYNPADVAADALTLYRASVKQVNQRQDVVRSAGCADMATVAE